MIREIIDNPGLYAMALAIGAVWFVALAMGGAP